MLLAMSHGVVLSEQADTENKMLRVPLGRAARAEDIRLSNPQSSKAVTNRIPTSVHSNPSPKVNFGNHRTYVVTALTH